MSRRKKEKPNDPNITPVISDTVFNKTGNNMTGLTQDTTYQTVTA